MKAIISLIKPAFDWTWHNSVQVALLVGLVLVVQTVLARWLTPRLRYTLSLLILLRLLLPFAPSSPLSLQNLWPRATPPAAPPAAAPAVVEPFSPPAIALEPLPVEPLPAPPRVTSYFSSPPKRPLALSLAQVLVLVWACGLVALVALAGWRYGQWCRRVRCGRRLSDPRLLALLDEAREAMGVRRPVALVALARLGSPAVFGFRRVRLLLQETMPGQLTDRDLRLLFLHEMAHVRRHDMLLNLVLMAVQFMHWFNPLVWLGLHRLRADRELVCDAMVLQRSNPEERVGYGMLLLKLLTDFPTFQAMVPTTVPVVSSKRELKRRIILIKHHRRSSLAAYVATGLAALALATTTFTSPSPGGAGGIYRDPWGNPYLVTVDVAASSSATNPPSGGEIRSELVNTNGRTWKILQREVTVHLDNVPLQELLANLSTNWGVTIVHDKSLPALTNKLSIKLDKVKLGDIFRYLSRNYALQFQVGDELIWVVDAKNPKGIEARSGTNIEGIVRSLYHDYSHNSIWHDRNSRILDKEMTVHLDNVPLEALLANLSTDVGVCIVPDKSLPALTKRLSVNLDRVKFRDLLRYIGRNYALEFEVGDEFIWAVDARPGNGSPEETKIWILPKEAFAAGKDAGSSTPLLSERAIKDQFKGIYMIDPKNLMLAARGTPEQLDRLDTVIDEVWAKLPKRVSPWAERWKADQRVQLATPEFRALMRAALATQGAELTKEQRTDLERLLDLWGRAYNAQSFERFMEFRAPSRIEVLGSSLEYMTNWMAKYQGESVNGLTPRELLKKNYKHEDTFALTEIARGSLEVLVRRVGDLKDEFLGSCFDFRRDDAYCSPSDKSPCKYDLDPEAVLAADKSLLCVRVAGAYFTSVGKDYPIPVLTFFYWVPSQSVWRPMSLIYGSDLLGDQRNKGWSLYF